MRLPSAHRRPAPSAARAASLAGALVLALAACSGGVLPEPSTTATVTVDATVDPSKAAPPPPTLPVVWPLTGLPTDAVAARPALAVKIENSTVARPQTGLDQADMVWEEVVEGGITRFVAVFHSQVPDEVGPIRSVRPMDASIVAPMKGLLAFSGGAAPFVAAVKATGVQIVSMDAGSAGFYRKRGVAAAPHNVYGTVATFWGQADADHGAPPAPVVPVARTAAAATAVSQGTPATTLNLSFSREENPSWSWDAGTGTWLRSESGQPATVRSGARIAATNVLVLQVQVDPNVGTDPAGNPIPETILAGSSGTGVLASGGQSVPVTWSKADVAAGLVVTTTTGTAATLAPGTTWVELVPAATGSVTVG